MVRRISRYKCDLADNMDLMARRITLPVNVRGTLATKKTPPRSRLKDATLSVENRWRHTIWDTDWTQIAGRNGTGCFNHKLEYILHSNN